MSTASRDRARRLPEGSDPVDDLPEAETGGVSFDLLDILSQYGNAPAWAISLGIHLLVIFMLSLVATKGQMLNDLIPVVSVLDDTEAPPMFDAVAVDQVGTGAETDALLTAAEMATARGDNQQQKVEQEIEENILPVKEPMTADVEIPQESDLVSNLNTQGAAVTEAPQGGTKGSIDRIAFEIAASLKERKTLVIWMFDASLSLKDRREEIADRFENVYQQLGALEVDAEKALKTAVVSYGEKTTILTPEPVDDVKQVIEQVRAIKNDVSGKEIIFSAVTQVVQKWQSFRKLQRRNIMLVIVTDERGDDIENLESAISICRSVGVKTYVVGNASPFGQQHGFVPWTYSDGTTEDQPVDQGPETVLPEGLRLGFWGVNGYDLDRMSSGYGPYGLTRLCAESGGMYLIAAQDQKGKTFSHEVMRAYAPDYRPIKTYDFELKKNKAKILLTQVAASTIVKGIPLPPLTFQADTDNVLREQIGEAQKPIADLAYRLDEVVAVLEQGEKDREKIREPRWQAAFDLAYGRALAMKVRALGYNTMLADMKLTPKTFTKKGNNQWRLAPSKDITSGPSIKKIGLKAQMYLNRVVDSHPDTPWAMLAERELSAPLGWAWEEGQMAVPGMGLEGEAKEKAIRLAEEEQKKAQMRAQQRAKERPKL